MEATLELVLQCWSNYLNSALLKLRNSLMNKITPALSSRTGSVSPTSVLRDTLMMWMTPLGGAHTFGHSHVTKATLMVVGGEMLGNQFSRAVSMQVVRHVV